MHLLVSSAMGSMRVAALALITVLLAVVAAGMAAPSSQAAPAGFDSVATVRATTASPSAVRDGWKIELVSLGSDTARVGDRRRFRVKVTNNSKKARTIRLDVLFKGVEKKSIRRANRTNIKKRWARGQTKNNSGRATLLTKRLKPGQMARVVLRVPFTAGLPGDQLRVKLVARTAVKKRIRGKVRRRLVRVAKDQVVVLKKEEPAPVDDKPAEPAPEDDGDDPALVDHDWVLGRWTFVPEGGEMKITKKGDQYWGQFTSLDNAVGQVKSCNLPPPEGQWKLTPDGHGEGAAFFKGTIKTWIACNPQSDAQVTWSLTTSTPIPGNPPQKRSLFLHEFGGFELRWLGP